MPYNVKVIEKRLTSLGFEKIKNKKCAHARWKHPDGRRTTVPNHGCNEVKVGTFKSILKDIRITKDEFVNLS